MSYRVVVAGATGACGTAIVRELAQSGKCAGVTALVRRPHTFAGRDRERVSSVQVPSLDALLTDSGGHGAAEVARAVFGEGVQFEAAVCALGSSMKESGGSREAFRRVDYDYVCAFVRAALAAGARRVVLVSAAGASEDSWLFYLRVKGEAERAVSALCREQGATLWILRPALLLTPPRNRGIRHTAEAAAQWLVRTLRLSMGGHLAVTVEEVARITRDALDRAEGEGAHGLQRVLSRNADGAIVCSSAAIHAMAARWTPSEKISQ